MSTDDNGELWLSTDDSSLNAVRIAREPVWGNLREWTGSGQGGTGTRCDAGPCLNISDPIHLVAGNRYYTELLWKEGGWRRSRQCGLEAGKRKPIQSTARRRSGATYSAPPCLKPSRLLSVSPPISLHPWVPVMRPSLASTSVSTRWTRMAPQSRSIRRPAASRSWPVCWGPNVADLSAAVNGIFAINTVVNWDQGGSRRWHHTRRWADPRHSGFGRERRTQHGQHCRGDYHLRRVPESGGGM